jgi:hypothetical protein
MMDKVQKYNSFNTNTPSSESYRSYLPFHLYLLPIIMYAADILPSYIDSALNSFFVFIPSVDEYQNSLHK